MLAPLYQWYALMCTLAVVNLFILGYRLCTVNAQTHYEKTMKWLAAPWVWECAYRGVFPSLYLQRYVFWDIILNSILIDRTFACFGELSWVYQTTYALRYIDTQGTLEVHKGTFPRASSGTRWIQASAWLAFAIYVVAEGCSYYNVATTNELWAAIEVFLDGLSYLVMAPASLSLFLGCPDRAAGVWSSGRVYLTVMPVVCILYPLYNFFIDVPMYMDRYHEDQAEGKTYFSFVDGLKDAAVTRIKTHDFDDWSADMFWMVAYFSLGAWSGLLMMGAPALVSVTPTTTTVRGDDFGVGGYRGVPGDVVKLGQKGGKASRVEVTSKFLGEPLI